MNRLRRDMRRAWVRGMNAQRQLRHVPSGSQRAGILIADAAWLLGGDS